MLQELLNFGDLAEKAKSVIPLAIGGICNEIGKDAVLVARVKINPKTGKEDVVFMLVKSTADFKKPTKEEVIRLGFLSELVAEVIGVGSQVIGYGELPNEKEILKIEAKKE